MGSVIAMDLMSPTSDPFLEDMPLGDTSAGASPMPDRQKTFAQLLLDMQRLSSPEAQARAMAGLDPHSNITELLVTALCSANPELRKILEAQHIIPTQTAAAADANENGSETVREKDTPSVITQDTKNTTETRADIDGIYLSIAAVNIAIREARKNFKGDPQAQTMAAATTIKVATVLKKLKRCDVDSQCVATASGVVMSTMNERMKTDLQFINDVHHQHFNQAYQAFVSDGSLAAHLAGATAGIDQSKLSADVANAIAKDLKHSSIDASVAAIIKQEKTGFANDPLTKPDNTSKRVPSSARHNPHALMKKPQGAQTIVPTEPAPAAFSLSGAKQKLSGGATTQRAQLVHNNRLSF